MAHKAQLNIPADIAAYIKECRKSSNMTQQEMANFLGVTVQHYQRLEWGKCRPTLKTLEQLNGRREIMTKYSDEWEGKKSDIKEVISNVMNCLAIDNPGLKKNEICEAFDKAEVQMKLYEMADQIVTAAKLKSKENALA